MLIFSAYFSLEKRERDREEKKRVVRQEKMALCGSGQLVRNPPRGGCTNPKIIPYTRAIPQGINHVISNSILYGNFIDSATNGTGLIDFEGLLNHVSVVVFINQLRHASRKSVDQTSMVPMLNQLFTNYGGVAVTELNLVPANNTSKLSDTVQPFPPSPVLLKKYFTSGMDPTIITHNIPNAIMDLLNTELEAFHQSNINIFANQGLRNELKTDKIKANSRRTLLNMAGILNEHTKNMYDDLLGQLPNECLEFGDLHVDDLAFYSATIELTEQENNARSNPHIKTRELTLNAILFDTLERSIDFNLEMRHKYATNPSANVNNLLKCAEERVRLVQCHPTTTSVIVDDISKNQMTVKWVLVGDPNSIGVLTNAPTSCARSGSMTSRIKVQMLVPPAREFQSETRVLLDWNEFPVTSHSNDITDKHLIDFMEQLVGPDENSKLMNKSLSNKNTEVSELLKREQRREQTADEKKLELNQPPNGSRQSAANTLKDALKAHDVTIPVKYIQISPDTCAVIYIKDLDAGRGPGEQGRRLNYDMAGKEIIHEIMYSRIGYVDAETEATSKFTDNITLPQTARNNSYTTYDNRLKFRDLVIETPAVLHSKRVFGIEEVLIGWCDTNIYHHERLVSALNRTYRAMLQCQAPSRGDTTYLDYARMWRNKMNTCYNIISELKSVTSLTSDTAKATLRNHISAPGYDIYAVKSNDGCMEFRGIARRCLGNLCPIQAPPREFIRMGCLILGSGCGDDMHEINLVLKYMRSVFDMLVNTWGPSDLDEPEKRRIIHQNEWSPAWDPQNKNFGFDPVAQKQPTPVANRYPGLDTSALMNITRRIMTVMKRCLSAGWIDDYDKIEGTIMNFTSAIDVLMGVVLPIITDMRISYTNIDEPGGSNTRLYDVFIDHADETGKSFAARLCGSPMFYASVYSDTPEANANCPTEHNDVPHLLMSQRLGMSLRWLLNEPRCHCVHKIFIAYLMSMKLNYCTFKILLNNNIGLPILSSIYYQANFSNNNITAYAAGSIYTAEMPTRQIKDKNENGDLQLIAGMHVRHCTNTVGSIGMTMPITMSCPQADNRDIHVETSDKPIIDVSFIARTGHSLARPYYKSTGELIRETPREHDPYFVTGVYDTVFREMDTDVVGHNKAMGGLVPAYMEDDGAVQSYLMLPTTNHDLPDKRESFMGISKIYLADANGGDCNLKSLAAFNRYFTTQRNSDNYYMTNLTGYQFWQFAPNNCQLDYGHQNNPLATHITTLRTHDDGRTQKGIGHTRLFFERAFDFRQKIHMLPANVEYLSTLEHGLYKAKNDGLHNKSGNGSYDCWPNNTGDNTGKSIARLGIAVPFSAHSTYNKENPFGESSQVFDGRYSICKPDGSRMRIQSPYTPVLAPQLVGAVN